MNVSRLRKIQKDLYDRLDVALHVEIHSERGVFSNFDFTDDLIFTLSDSTGETIEKFSVPVNADNLDSIPEAVRDHAQYTIDLWNEIDAVEDKIYNPHLYLD